MKNRNSELNNNKKIDKKLLVIWIRKLKKKTFLLKFQQNRNNYIKDKRRSAFFVRRSSLVT